jgi:large subunit ribosomal protein L17
MRHRKAGVKLNMTSSHKQAMFRNMVTSLFKHDRIRTTDAKAKELRRLADHMVTLAKRGDLHARRQAMSFIREKDVVHKLFAEAGDRFGSVSGGYTRVVKLGRRPGDAAPVSLIELVTTESRDKKKKQTPKAKTAAPKKAQEAVKEKAAAAEAAVAEKAPAAVEGDAVKAQAVADTADVSAAPEEAASDTEPAEAVQEQKAEASQPEAVVPDTDVSDDPETEEPKDKTD